MTQSCTWKLFSLYGWSSCRHAKKPCQTWFPNLSLIMIYSTRCQYRLDFFSQLYKWNEIKNGSDVRDILVSLSQTPWRFTLRRPAFMLICIFHIKRTVRQNRTPCLYYCRFSIGFWSKVLFQTLLYSYCWRHGK